MTKQRKNPRADQQIDENLRRVYSEAAQEPVPDRFMLLLDQLRQQEQSGASTRDGEDGADT